MSHFWGSHLIIIIWPDNTKQFKLIQFLTFHIINITKLTIVTTTYNVKASYTLEI